MPASRSTFTTASTLLAYAEAYPVTMNDLLRIPAFHSIWLALDECARFNCRVELDAE
jgi:hypothetical protein